MGVTARQEQTVRGRQLGRAPFRGDESAAQRLKIQRRILRRRDQLHPVVPEEFRQGALQARRAADAADQDDAAGRDGGFEQHAHVFAHGVEQPGQDAAAVLALVRQVRHVALEDHRAASGERRRAIRCGGERAGGLDRERKTLDQLPEEVAGALRATAVLAENLELVGAQFEDGEAVAANGHDGGGLVAEEEAAGAGLRLLDRHLRQVDLRGKPAAHRGAGSCVPAPR